MLSRVQPLPRGAASIRCHGDGVCFSFPIGRAAAGGVASRRYHGDRALRPDPRSPIGCGRPVPAGDALPMATALEAALGTACCWGLSPALDLHQHFLDAGSGDATALLVGAAEGRHLLLTASRAHREPRSTLTIFVAEQRPEAVARQLLFLLLATTEPPGSTGLRARAAALLELVGSVRLRPSTARLLGGAAERLRRWVTAGGEGEPPLELELMKVEVWGDGGEMRGEPGQEVKGGGRFWRV
ncbi:dynein assembly factor 3, axonemal-like [Numida meleagris]|uniref:dynein assembly factor 3, axonemal-like n=1 Tax=Numida meleagris TaxID=8996 RepID=UPI000B3D8613|nr:dynein assembly factor 3, axonemal-like [Numida meleagris]